MRWSASLSTPPLTVACVTLLVACSGEDPAPVGVADLSLASSTSPHVPSVLLLEGALPEGVSPSAQATVVATAEGLPEVRTESVASAPLSLPLPRLVPGQSYDVSVELTDAGAVVAQGSLSVEAPALPAALQGFQLAREGPIGVPYVALSLIRDDGRSYLAILDDQARVVWWRQAAEGQVIITPTLSIDGRSLNWGEYDHAKLEDTGTWYQVPLDGTEGSQRRIDASHHAAIELPDDRVAWLAFDFRDVLLSTGETERMATDRIYEGDHLAYSDPVEIFNTFDDHPDPPTLTCHHMTGPFDRFDERNILEWTHGNSLAYVPSEDALYLNAKQVDWVLKIDRATGELLWQLGGIGTDFTYPDGSPVWTDAYEPTLFSHGHMSQVWEGGMTMFDNGDHRTPPHSSIAELAWDEESRTVERVWEFFHPRAGYTYPLGDVKKLDDGTYLSTWGATGEIMVVSPGKEVLWAAQAPPRYTLGRVVPLETW